VRQQQVWLIATSSATQQAAGSNTRTEENQHQLNIDMERVKNNILSVFFLFLRALQLRLLS
jgi:hypothetical protein